MPILRVIRSASAILFALVLTAAFTGCGTRADSEYEKGVEAYLRRDYANAVLHYREAAKRDHAEAQFQLGCCYENGEGVPADFAEAVKWWIGTGMKMPPEELADNYLKLIGYN